MNQTEARLLKMRVTELEKLVKDFSERLKSIEVRWSSITMSALNETVKRGPGRPRKNDGSGTATDSRG